MTFQQQTGKPWSSRLTEAHNAYVRGDYGAAAEGFRAVLQEEREGHEVAYQLLGVLAMRVGNMELALQLCDAALLVAPNLVAALVNKAVALRSLGRKEEARRVAEEALKKGPNSSEALHTASYLAMEAREYERALMLAREAVRLAPDAPLPLANYANALMVQGDFVEAVAAARRAVELRPDEASFQFTLGQILRGAGYPSLAVAHFRKASDLKPDYVDARTAEAAALSVIGDFERAWSVWEARPYDYARFKALKRWDGSFVDHLLIHAEQGMGDALHFARFVSLAREKVGRVTIQAPAPLVVLFKASFPETSVIAPQDTLPFDVSAHVPMMSLPYLFHTRFDTIPPPLAIRTDKCLREIWRDYLKDMPMPRIGICWAGNPNHTNDHNRSVPQEALKSLFAEFSGHLISLQNGAIQRIGADGPFPQDDPLAASVAAAGADPISSTAALMMELDLVVTVDSFTAHLAGSLQRATWMMVPFDPDWRWLYGREDSVWYSTIRLFRQKKPKDWDLVVGRITGELRRFIAGERRVIAPPVWTGRALLQHPQAVEIPL